MISRVFLAGVATIQVAGCGGPGGTDGGGPNGGILFDSFGNAYGTTHFGGIAATCVLFEITR